ncbi:2-hydroxychromene-2-carboxylate isomerase [Simplicispira lacusdiani]|uniref:2-hydroxychromene-2-carboxylate isomerase n=1 Tax=Simplicispira lacusdiani TaxID=2213010 RepID=UPI000E723285|nr:2-hydroxychromene-2-carboxylate isomerase [Simplicispira lacusdiani]
MSKTVEFLFDVGSPYTYLAYRHLPVIAQAHGARIVWTPVLLGGIFQATGNASPAEVPAKSLHSQVDLQRWARTYGVPFRMNPHFPINTLALMRGAVAAQMQGDEVLQRYLSAIFPAMFEQPRNLGEPAEIGAALAGAGLDPVQFLQWIADPAVKEKLKQNTARAVERGVFGAPTFFVGDEMFWGQDRLEFVAQALAG